MQTDSITVVKATCHGDWAVLLLSVLHATGWPEHLTVCSFSTMNLQLMEGVRPCCLYEGFCTVHAECVQLTN